MIGNWRAARRVSRDAPLVMALAGLLVGFAVPAGAADLPTGMPVVKVPEPAATASNWKYELAIYGWGTALTGDVGVRNLPTTSVDVPFSEVLDNLDGALMGTLFASNGKWIALADVVLAKLSHGSSADVLGGSSYDLGLNQTILTGALGYLLDTGRKDLDVGLTVGARYVRLKGDLGLDPNLLPGSFYGSQTQWWVDPTVGLYAHWQVNEKWFVNAIADIGGFGAGSKLSSTGYLGVGYLWTDSFSTALGYRYLYEDYVGSGAKTGTFRYNTTMHGPTVALAWHF